LSLEDPLAILRKVVASVGIDPLKIPWDATGFGKQSDLPLYIYQSNLEEILAEN